jgi:hypothetical protein
LLFSITAKAVVGIPYMVEAETLDQALQLAPLDKEDTPTFLIEMLPASQWIVRTEAELSVLTSLYKSVKELLDYFAQSSASIYDDERIITALQALRDADVVLESTQQIQRELNARSAISGHLNEDGGEARV